MCLILSQTNYFKLNSASLRPSEHSLNQNPSFSQRHVFDLGAIFLWKKTFCSFHLCRDWARNSPGNRCFTCLMLPCCSPAGWETWSNHDLIHETHDAVASLLLPFWWSDQVPKIRTAVMNNTPDTLTAGQKQPLRMSWTRCAHTLDSLHELMKKLVWSWLLWHLNCLSSWEKQGAILQEEELDLAAPSQKIYVVSEISLNRALYCIRVLSDSRTPKISALKFF